MAEANPKVMEMVEAELKKDPDVSNQALREKAKSVDRSIEKLTPRQFNATYPLQVKRSLKPARKGPARKRGKAAPAKVSRRSRRRGAGAGKGGDATGSRDQVRKVLVDLARVVAEGDRGALVEVVAGLDRYVDRVMKAAG
ncbi:MAG TPA: hypothetical protein VMM12_14990 [Longimicrobiales bacterium]|nr:hypothetical protein [Longimicrobiales bacterium]